jgi:CDP-glucose 4,6-dehydratase
VLEPLAGYLSVATRNVAALPDPDSEPTWNFGPHPSEIVTAADLATAVVTSWGTGRWKTADEPPAGREATSLRISIKKAQKELGWSPRWAFQRAASRTIDWYRAFYEDQEGSMRDHSLGDIEAYEKSLPIA